MDPRIVCCRSASLRPMLPESKRATMAECGACIKHQAKKCRMTSHRSAHAHHAGTLHAGSIRGVGAPRPVSRAMSSSARWCTRRLLGRSMQLSLVPSAPRPTQRACVRRLHPHPPAISTSLTARTRTPQQVIRESENASQASGVGHTHTRPTGGESRQPAEPPAEAKRSPCTTDASI